MKQKIILFAVSALVATKMQAQQLTFGVSGNAYQHGIGVYNMVPGPYTSGYTAGAAWSHVTLDFTHRFVVDFKAMIQPRGLNLPEDVADGFVMVFGSHINTTTGGTLGGVTGNDMGYYSPVPGTSLDLESNSIGVEFDFDNDGPAMEDADPNLSNPHVMITRNADVHNVLMQPVFPGFVKAKADFPNGGAFYDATKHKYRVEWDCADQLLSVYQDGIQVVFTTFDPSVEFTNPAAVKWGFTAARGDLNPTATPGGAQITIWNPVIQQSQVCNGCNASLSLDFASYYCDYTNNTYQVGINYNWIPLPGYIMNSVGIEFGDGSKYSTNTQTGFSPITHTYATHGWYNLKLNANSLNQTTGEQCNEPIDVYFWRPDCTALHQFPDEEVGWLDIAPKFSNTQDGTTNTAASSASMTTLYNDNIKLYPNPSTGDMKIELSNSFIEINVTDMMGRTVFDESYSSITSKTIDLNRLPNGIYLISVTASDGKEYKEKIQLNK
ncbi:T9SS type A sorting domain-containing protein [Polluticoccus soli]|uniref:T9SS type A sorting domain-containing protein n=1 Tax=Polluticoccus soli TaxID=3034150 RepID=UPI0023E2D121|nr:T9SS type A sorting domain-containing protein [Flavipsychrobacter sp. JY13-12]